MTPNQALPLLLHRWLSAPVAIAILLCALAGPARGAYPGRPGPIAYSQSATTVNAEFEVEFSGGLFAHGPRQTQRPYRLTDEPGDTAPAYSADGRWIAFEADRTVTDSTGPHIYLMRSDGGAVRQLTSGGYRDSNPYFSPDGRRIVFDRAPMSGGTSHIFVADVASGRVRQLTRGSGGDREPVFTPSGRRIVFVSNRDPDGRRDRGDIWAMASNGAQPKLLVDGHRTESEPDVSPDGRRLVFVSNRGGAPAPYVSKANGRSARALARPYDACDPCYASPAWSPSGRHIVMLRGGRFGSSILVARADGRRFTKFASGSTEVEGYGTTLGPPAWGPVPR